jgi:hypothetical protein
MQWQALHLQQQWQAAIQQVMDRKINHGIYNMIFTEKNQPWNI